MKPTHPRAFSEHIASPRRWPFVVVAIVTLIVFAPLATCEFSWWDDFQTIHQNPWLKEPPAVALKHYWTSIAYGLYIPATYTAWIALTIIGKLDQPDDKGIWLNPWIFHSANVLVHLITALFAFLLLRRLVKKDLPACLGTILFAVHPVQVESVGWVSGLKDVLAGCFAMIALWRYVKRAQQPNTNHWLPDIAGTLALLAALLAKPSAMMTPFIAICIDRWILQRPWRSVVRAAGIWIILIFPFAITARLGQTTAGLYHAPIWARPFIAGDTIAFYLYKLVLPIWLGMDYGRRPQWLMQQPWFWFAWIVPLLVALLIWRARRGWLTAAALVFLLAFLPVCGLSTFQFQFASTTADHYLYVAMLGPAMAMAFVMLEFDRKSLRIVTCAALLLLAVRASIQTRVWHDDLALFGNALRVNPRSFIAENNLGAALQNIGENDAALQHYRASMRINPQYANAYENVARVLAAKGDIDGSIDAIEESIRIRAQLPLTLHPNYMEDHNRVGQILMVRGEYARAIAHFVALLAIKPEHAEAKRSLNIARERLAAPTTAPSKS